MKNTHPRMAQAKAALRAALLVLAVLLALAWAWYTTAKAANEQPRYQIINDDYDHITAPIDPVQGLYQQIKAGPETPLYGVRLNLATYNKVVHGTLHVDLLDQSGTVLAGASADMTQVLDNTFMGLVFDHPVFPQKEESYQLHLYTEPAGPEDVVGLWAGPEKPGMALSDPLAKEPLKESAAIQYMIDYTGGVVSRFYWVPAILLAAAVLAGGWLIWRRAKAETVFCVAGLLIGMAFSLITPPLAAPDEYAHVAASYGLSNRLFGQQEWDEQGRLYMRPCDAPYMTAQSGEIGPFAYKTVAEHLLDTGCSNDASIPVEVKTPYPRVHLLYVAQTVGVTLARALGLGFYGMLWLGRLGNLAVYLLLVWLAVRHMPFGKDLLSCVALLPMSMQLAASFSTDALVLGVCFAFTAMTLEAMAQPGMLRRGQTIGILLLSAALGPCKAVYVVLLALVWLIPKEKFAKPLMAWLFRLGSLGAALVGWLAYNFGTVAYLFRDVTLMGLPILLALGVLAAGGLWYAVRRWGKSKWFRIGVCVALCLVLAVGMLLVGKGWLHMAGTLTPEEVAASIQPNGESIYTYSVGYTLRHLPAAARLLITTLTQDGPLILQEVLGTRLSEPIVYTVEVSWLCTVGLVLVLAAACLRTQEEPRRLPGAKAWVLGGVFAAAVLLIVAASFTWTPINMQHLFGLQGRYLLPVLPVLLLCLGENSSFFKKHISGGGVRLAGMALTAVAALQGLCLYAAA